MHAATSRLREVISSPLLCTARTSAALYSVLDLPILKGYRYNGTNPAKSHKDSYMDQNLSYKKLRTEPEDQKYLLREHKEDWNTLLSGASMKGQENEHKLKYRKLFKHNSFFVLFYSEGGKK